jgi:hypothetical protein
MCRIAGLLSMVACMGAVAAQDVQPATSRINGAVVERNLAGLEAHTASLAEAVAKRDALIAEAALETLGEDRKAEIQARIDLERERILQLRQNIRDIIGGTEVASFEEEEKIERTFQEQFGDVVKPFLSALQEPTSRLREMEEMRSTRDAWRIRRDSAQRVIDRIAGLDSANDAAEASVRVAGELESARRFWELQRDRAAAQVDTLTLQIEERERTTPTFWQAATTMIGDFIKSRGLNLLLAIVAAVLAFILTRRIYQWFRSISPVHKKGGSLIGRASDLLAFSAAVLASITGVLVVFFARGDWLLLTLSAILLVGVLWAGKTALPPYIEQIRMLLNLGAVREGERIIYQGLPWRVETLGFYTVLENPALHGGRMRIPLRRVMEMISRKPRSDEPWFPCQQGDWVLLSDDTHGQIEHLTPEQVVLRCRGGSLKTYQTPEFLELAPENLAPGFRVRSIFGIDYSHLTICTTEAPQVFRAAVRELLVAEFGEESVKDVVVDFHEAGSSSLDYAVKADLTHAAAARYRYVPRLIQRACVDACNARGWVIPFTQITLHQAK